MGELVDIDMAGVAKGIAYTGDAESFLGGVSVNDIIVAAFWSRRW